MAFNEVVRSPVYVQIAEQLRQAILAGELSVGDELPTERELSQTFAASRASVREALRVLQAQGLITGGGAPARAVVCQASPEPASDALTTLLELNAVSLDDLVELRCVLEGAAVRRAGAKPDPAQLGEAREAVSEMRAADGDIEAFDQADVRFHVALVCCSRNEAMHLVMLALRDPAVRHLREALRSHSQPRRTLRRLVSEHEQILQALEEGDPERAASLLESHIRRFYRNYGRRKDPSRR